MKNRTALIWLILANLISGFASGITMQSIPWYLTSQGGDSGKLLNTLMMSVITLLSLFFGLYAGTLIDKYNRKRIFQVMNLINGCILLGTALYGKSVGEMPFPFIALVAGATLFSYTIHFPNLYAFVQELFEPKYYKRLNAAIEIQNQITRSLGVICGGIFLAGSAEVSWWPEWLSFRPWSLADCCMLDGITYFISFLLISMIPYTPGAYHRIAAGGVWERMRSGFQYLREHKPLLLFGLCSYVIYFSLMIFVQVVVHTYVSGYLGFAYAPGSRVVSEYNALYSIGALVAGIAGLAAARLMGRGNLVLQIAVLVLLSAGMFVVYSLTQSAVVLITGAFFLGLTNAGTRILRITYIVRIVPNHYIGRVNSFFQTMNSLARSIFLAGLALPFFSGPSGGSHIVWATAALAAICAICGLMLIFNFSTFDKKAAYG